MEGVYFYWIAWIAWIITTFLMEKTNQRLRLSVLILLVIIVSSEKIPFFQYEISGSIVFALIISIGFLRRNPFKAIAYLFICSLTITAAYVSFHLLEIYDPVWILFDRKWMLTIGLAFLNLLLMKNIEDRIHCIIISVCQGELLFGFILSRLQFQYGIGEMITLDILALSLGVVFVWSKLEQLISHFDAIIHKTLKEKL